MESEASTSVSALTKTLESVKATSARQKMVHMDTFRPLRIRPVLFVKFMVDLIQFNTIQSKAILHYRSSNNWCGFVSMGMNETRSCFQKWGVVLAIWAKRNEGDSSCKFR